MAGVKLKLQPRYAHLFDNHAKGEPRQRIAHLYQTIRMRPAIFGRHIKDMDNVKPACAVIFRSDIGETVESLLGKLSPTELQTLGYTIDAIDYARRAEIAIYKRDPPSFSLLAEHPEGGLIVGQYVTQEEKDQIMWRLWYILAMLMVDDDTLADEEQTPWDEICLSVTLYCWVKHLMGVTACISESTCRCANTARTYGIPASAFRAAWVYVDKRCHRWLPSDRYRTIPISNLAPEVRMTDIFMDTEPPEKLPMMASVIHLPIPPYHSIRLKPSSSRSLSPVKSSTSAQHNRKPNSAMPCDPLEDVVEVPVHPSFHTKYTEMRAVQPSIFGYDLVAKLVSRTIVQKQGINSKWKSIVLREEGWVVVGWALVCRRLLGLCIQDICGVIPSPIEGFKPWHIGRLVDVLMYLQFRKQRVAVTPKNIHGYYPSFRTLVISAKHNSSARSPSRTTEGESLRRWILLRALWELLGRLFVWEDANLKSVGGGSGLLSTTQNQDSVHSTLVIDWKSTAFPLAITSWVKHSLPYSTCYLSVNDANCKCKNACKLYNVSYDEFLAAYRVVDSICKREGWTIDSMTFTKTSNSKVIGSVGKTSSAPASTPPTPSIATDNVVDHLSPIRAFGSTKSQGSLSGGNENKSSEAVLDGSPKRKTSSDRTLARAPAPMPSDGRSPLQTHDNPTVLPSPSPKKSHTPIPSPRMQDKSIPPDLTRRRSMVSLKTPRGVESSTKLEDEYDNSVDSSSGSGSDQSFKPERAFHDIDGSGRSGSRPREAETHVIVRTRRSTRLSPSHKLIDWSSESDGEATPDELRKGNRRGRVPPSAPGPSEEGKRPRGRPRKYRPPRTSAHGVGMAAARPRGRPRRKPVTMSTSPNPHLNSQMGQSHCPSDFIGPNNLNVTVPRHLEVEVSTGHRPLVSANLMSPGECGRHEGRVTYVSKAPIDDEGVPKPVNGQKGTHDRKSGSDLDLLDNSREVEHQVTHTVGRKPTVMTGPLEMKKRKYHRDRLAPGPGEIEVLEENQPKAKRFKREHPVVGSSGHHQIRGSTILSSSIPEVSLLIYDLNPDRRKTSLAEERRRLLNMCRLFGIPIALNVETVPENGGIGICEPLSAEVVKKLNFKKISNLRDNFGLALSFKPPTPLLHSPMLPTPPASSCALNPAKSFTSSSVSEVDVHSEPEEQDTLSFYDDQSEPRINLAEEADRLVGLIQEVCKTNLKDMDWNIEKVHGHVAVVLQDKDAIRRACSMLAPTSVRKEISRRNVTVLRGEERWVVPPAAPQWLVPKNLHQPSNVKFSARYQRNLALFNKTVAARSWTSAAVQGFHW